MSATLVMYPKKPLCSLMESIRILDKHMKRQKEDILGATSKANKLMALARMTPQKDQLKRIEIKNRKLIKTMVEVSITKSRSKELISNLRREEVLGNN